MANGLKDKVNKIETDISSISTIAKDLVDALNRIKTNIDTVEKEAEETKEKTKEKEAEIKEEFRIEEEPEETRLYYYNQCYLKFNSERIILILNNNRTKSTQTRLNEMSDVYKLGYRVRREKVDTPQERWWVEYKNSNIEFQEDQLILRRKKD